MSNLQPKQFWYHGSNADLSPGKDQILPANSVGRSNYDYDESWSEGAHRGDYTFAADTEEEAEAWTPSGGRPTTYVVDPAEGAEIEEEYEHVEYEDATHFKIKGPMNIIDRIDIPLPGGPNRSVQGTLPPVDWSQYRVDPRKQPQRNVYDHGNHLELFHGRAPAEGQGLDERADYEAKWKKAGQQELDL